MTTTTETITLLHTAETEEAYRLRRSAKLVRRQANQNARHARSCEKAAKQARIDGLVEWAESREQSAAKCRAFAKELRASARDAERRADAILESIGRKVNAR